MNKIEGVIALGAVGLLAYGGYVLYKQITAPFAALSGAIGNLTKSRTTTTLSKTTITDYITQLVHDHGSGSPPPSSGPPSTNTGGGAVLHSWQINPYGTNIFNPNVLRGQVNVANFTAQLTPAAIGKLALRSGETPAQVAAKEAYANAVSTYAVTNQRFVPTGGR